MAFYVRGGKRYIQVTEREKSILYDKYKQL
jgi:hypothetical protein